MSVFKMGQLVCAINGLSDSHPGKGILGNITYFGNDTVTVRAVDGEEEDVPTSSLKQVVHYDVDAGHFIEVGSPASVVALDHPYDTILPGEAVITSTVLSRNERKGFFETRNTVYIPNLMRYPDGMLHSKSPFLK